MPDSIKPGEASRYDAVFFLERSPQPNMGGAETYNLTIVEACLRLRLRTLVVVTGSAFPGAVFRAPALQGADTIYLHAFRIGRDRYVPSSLGAQLRALRRRSRSFVSRSLKAGAALQINSFADAATVRSAQRRLRGVEVGAVFVDTIFRHAFLDAVPDASRRILIGHDVFHERAASFRANGYQVQPDIRPEDEAAILGRFDAVVAISDRDAEAYRKLGPSLEVRTVLTAVRRQAAPPSPRGGRRMLYIGSAAYANVDGLMWFLQEVWPKVRAGAPEARLDVVGQAGANVPETPGVAIHGRVEDIQPIAAEAAFALNPVRMGSGLKIKMADYFAQGLGCITTSVGAQGFPAEGAPFAVRDGPQAFADEILRWLDDGETAAAMARLTAAYVERFSGGAAASTISGLIDPLRPVA